jgi:DNA-binding PadR family transcriptional regulator
MWNLSFMGSSDLIEKLQSRVIHEFMDLFILAEMKGDSLSGYDAIDLIHREFGQLVSPGTVYSLLYSLERNGWIRGTWNERKRVYELAEKSERNMEVIAKVNEGVQNFLRRISLIK